MADQLPAHSLAQGRGPLILAIAWTEALVALILMSMRVYTNALVVKSFRWDFFWALATLVTGMVSMALLTLSVTLGLGNHINLLEPSQIAQALQWIWIGQCVLIHSIGFGKFAVIAFIMRIQDRVHSRKKLLLTWFLYFIGVSNFIINVISMSIILTTCSPTAKFWNSALPGTCNHIKRHHTFGSFQGSWAASSDIVLAVIPIFIFWDLKISKKLKIGLCLLMAGGFLAAVAGILKTIYIKSITNEIDFTYAITPLIIWAWTENWLVLVLGSLPPLRPLFVQVFRLITVESAHHRRGHQGYHQQSDPNNIYMHPPADKTMPTDTDSERLILPLGSRIVRTTHVQVTSNSKKPRDDSDDTFNAI